MKRSSLLVLAPFVLAALALSLPLAAQASPSQETRKSKSAESQSSADKPRSRAKKVWTNDDLIELRTPTDRYLFEKERKEQEERAAREAERVANQNPAQPNPVAFPSPVAQIQLPDTIAGIDARIEELNSQISDLEQKLEDLEYLSMQGSEEDRAEAAKTITETNETLEKTRAELQLLQEKRTKLESPSPSSI